MDKPAQKVTHELKRKIREFDKKQVSMEKVDLLSALALELHRAGGVAESYDAFAAAVKAARSLPPIQVENALSRVRAEFRKTNMDISCYEGLLYPYRAPRSHDYYE